MYLKKPKASTDPRLRSLLQKAVRRGADCIVQAAIRNIIALGDRAWLRSRAVVLTRQEGRSEPDSVLSTRYRYATQIDRVQEGQTNVQDRPIHLFAQLPNGIRLTNSGRSPQHRGLVNGHTFPDNLLDLADLELE